jgi:hypothetical protein
MHYRIAKLEDAPAITELLGSTGYYGPVDAAELDGVVVVAEREGVLYGCVWAMVCGRHAYIDYLTVRPGHSGIMPLRLMKTLEAVLRKVGATYIRGVVKTDNTAAMRIDEAVGAVFDDGYSLGYRRL